MWRSSEVDDSLSFRDSLLLCCATVTTSVTTEYPKLSVVPGEPSISTVISAKNTSYSGRSGTEEDLALLIVEKPPYSEKSSDRVLPTVSSLW